MAEHAIAFYFALRRNLVRLQELTVGGVEWKRRWTLKGAFFQGEAPRTCREEVVGILGGGELGKVMCFCV